MIKPIIEILENTKVLSQLCEIYHQNTDMVISIHQPHTAERISFYPQGERSGFCKLIQSTPQGLRRCMDCDRDGLASARRKGSFHIYQCHAGLVDIVIPLDYKGVDMGCLMSGQVILEQPGLRDVGALFNRVKDLPGVSFDAFAHALATVKVVEQGRLYFYVKLLDLVANYIIMAENEIHLQKAIVSKDRELHRREIEKIRLEKTLKDLSISVLASGPRAKGSAARGGARGTATDHTIEKARSFIAENFNKDIVLEDVAHAVFLSPNYFSTLFKKVAGCSFRQYLARARIAVAQEMLARTDLPIKEIVFRVGFKDYNYFNRIFHLIAGMAPARFRHFNRDAASPAVFRHGALSRRKAGMAS